MNNFKIRNLNMRLYMKIKIFFLSTIITLIPIITSNFANSTTSTTDSTSNIKTSENNYSLRSLVLASMMTQKMKKKVLEERKKRKEFINNSIKGVSIIINDEKYISLPNLLAISTSHYPIIKKQLSTFATISEIEQQASLVFISLTEENMRRFLDSFISMNEIHKKEIFPVVYKEINNQLTALNKSLRIKFNDLKDNYNKKLNIDLMAYPLKFSASHPILKTNYYYFQTKNNSFISSDLIIETTSQLSRLFPNLNVRVDLYVYEK